MVNNVAVFGDSIPITSNGATYPDLLRETGFSVDVFCKSMSMSIDILDRLKTSEELDKYDLVILHFGIVDSSPRPLPMWLKRSVDGLQPKILRRAVKFVVKKCRRQMIWMTKGSYVLNPIECFVKDLKMIRDELEGHEVIFVNINNILDTVNTDVKKTRELYRSYNALIKNCFGASNVVDAYSISTNFNAPKYFIDGLHFSFEGHNYIAKAIIERLENRS